MFEGLYFNNAETISSHKTVPRGLGPIIQNNFY